ncbi:MAG: 50S ribosomal protein L9 [Candidatus Izemoplasmatales bacterium]|jgi:ribosomal protein L9|nr:50S ribosomal protein L9 [Candidatus Izemoplasmatales bacterium]
MKIRSIVFILVLSIFYTLASAFGFIYFDETFSLWYKVLYVVGVTLIPMIFLLSVLFNRKRRVRIRNLEEKIKEMNLLNKRLNNSEDIALNYLPVGMVIYDESYTISWANNAAKEYFSNVLTGRKLSVVHEELAKIVEKREGKSIVKIYDVDYEMIHYPKNKCVYLFEVSEREEIKKRLREKMNVVGIMSLDNFSEATQNLDFQEKTTIQGKFLSAIDNWCKKHHIYFINLKAEKSILLFTRKQLDSLMKEEFSIIDEVTTISNSNEIRVSLSLGIATMDGDIDYLGELAEEALKLALGRGGDQVVINIQNQPLKFFGGKTNTIEKRTKITARINARALSELIQKHDKVYIMPHKTTDIDALGGSVGLLHIALSEGKDAKIILDFDDIDQTCQKVINMLNREYVKLLSYFIDPEDALDEVNQDSLLILVDHHSPVQSNAPKMIEKTKFVVVIDHHRRMDNLLNEVLLNYVEPYASSSVELVIELIELYHKAIDIDPFEATMMLAGMMIDTNNFSFRTGVRTFEAAALLKQYGADPFKARLILRESLDDIKTKSNLVNQAQIYLNHFAITALSEDMKTDRVQLAKTADELLEIDNIIASFALGSLGNDTIGISARSVDKFNVSVIMEQFGGAGHLNNAGAQIVGSNMHDLVNKIEGILNTTFKEELTMKVILVKDVRGKGKKGEVIEVASGFGNFLLSSKQAIEASNSNLKSIEDEKAKVEKEALQEFELAKKLKDEIENSPIKLYVKIGETGKLFGAINSKQIAEEFKVQYNIEIDKRKIVLEDNIHSLGSFKVQVKLHKDVQAVINLQVLEEK